MRRGISTALVLVTLLSSAAFGAELILYLPFEEGQGDVAKDASGRGNDATLKGNAAWGQGVYGGGIEMVAGSFLTVEHSPDLALTESMTLMGWVRIPADTGDQQSLIEKGPVWGPGEYNLLPDYNNQVLLQMNDLPDNCDDEIMGGNVLDGQWHHVAGVWDGQEIRIYVDGQEVRAGQCEGVLEVNEQPLFIGSRGGSQRWLVGSIDEIKIYNGPLSEAEIQAAMEEQVQLAVRPQDKATVMWGAIKTAALR
ncbi:MAG: hypothetical protein KatS3mg115_2469 [Candidatus Poribacteria bacterium]|nr:MAG: hypothetical protein KatS3mg115_2469 [Candidatus Poribacteria bacterium]